MKLGASLPVGELPAEAARLDWGQRFRAWMDVNKIAVIMVRDCCGVGPSTVSKWRAGESMPGEKHRQALAEMGFETKEHT